MDFLFQFTDFTVQPDQVKYYSCKYKRNHTYHYPYLTIFTEPVGHFYFLGSSLLGQEVYTCCQKQYYSSNYSF